MREWSVLQDELRVSQSLNVIFAEAELIELKKIEAKLTELRKAHLADTSNLDIATQLKAIEEILAQKLITMRYGTESLGVVCAFLQYSIDYFNALLACLDSSIPDLDKEKLLRTILVMHGNVICKSSVDYFSNPNLSVHAASLTVANFIAGPAESVISILFPSVKRIVGVAPTDETGSFLSFISNDVVAFKDFVLSSSREELIDIQGVYHYARENPDRLFDVKRNQTEEKYFAVVPVDRYQFRTIAGQASIDYVDTLEKIYRINHDERPSIGYELRKLKDALLLSSKINGGSETIANDAACQGPIRVFHQHWMALHTKHKNKIKDCKSLGATDSLESLLLVLFAYTVGVSDKEFERVTQEKIFVCTHLIGKTLEILIAQHPDLNEIPLRGQSKHFKDKTLPTTEKVGALLDAAILALKTRVVPGCDQQLSSYFPLFASMVNLFCKPPYQESLDDRLKKLAPYVKDLHQLSSVLLLLPVAHWDSFFALYQTTILTIVEIMTRMQSQRMKAAAIAEGGLTHLLGAGFLDAQPLVYLLKSLPVSQWPLLFDLVHKNKLSGPFFSGGGPSSILRQFPKQEWQALSDAMSPLIDSILQTGKEVTNLLAISEDSRDYVVQLFYPQIEKILAKPCQLTHIFAQSDGTDWDDLFRIFSPMMKKNVHDDRWVHDVFSQLATAYLMLMEQGNITLTFLEKFVATFPEWHFKNEVIFVDFLDHFSIESWQRVCELTGKLFCAFVLVDGVALQAFLAQFQSMDARQLAIQSLAPFIQIEKNLSAKSLDEMLRLYPECQSSLLKIAEPALKELFSWFIGTFGLCDEAEDKYPPKVLNRFYYLLDKTLPVLTGLAHLQLKLKTEDFVQLPEFAQKLIQDLEKIDHAVLMQQYSVLDASYKKLNLIDNFFAVLEEVSDRGELEEPLRVFSEALQERLPNVAALSLLLDKRQEKYSNMDDVWNTRGFSIGVSPDALDKELQTAKTSQEVVAALNARRAVAASPARPTRSPTFFLEDNIERLRRYLQTPALIAADRHLVQELPTGSETESTAASTVDDGSPFDIDALLGDDAPAVGGEDVAVLNGVLSDDERSPLSP